jgi:glycosyltransferase involved in cell wall biosynthesis
MRILVASVQGPTPVRDGVSLRLWHLLDQLRHRHEIHVVCYGQPVDLEGVTSTTLPFRHQPGNLRRLALAARSIVDEPALVQRYRSAGLVQAVADVRGRHDFDVTHVNALPSAFVSDALGDLPRILDAIDAWHRSRREEVKASRFPRSFIDRGVGVPIRRFERAVLPRFALTTVVAASDRDALESVVQGARVEIVPNGVDSDYFAPPDVTRLPNLVAFHGHLGYPPNADAASFLAHDVMPLVAGAVPDARLRVIGREPPPQVRALAAQGVEVTGEVPDIRPLLAESAVVACALRTGTGIKNKLLEAAALGLPIVATSSALGDLDLTDGRELLVRDGAAAIADGIVSLLQDQEKARTLGASARAAIVKHWTWRAAASAFEGFYEELRLSSA